MEIGNYFIEFININATDCPIRIKNILTNTFVEYGVEGLPWKLLGNCNDKEVINYVFNNFESDIII